MRKRLFEIIEASSGQDTASSIYDTVMMAAILQSANEIDPGNRSDMNATRADMIARGYSPCGSCKP